MGLLQQVRLQCDHPRCEEEATVLGYDLTSLYATNSLPDGWWTGIVRNGQVVCCPEHAQTGRAAQRAVHDWREQQIAAQNKWLLDHPPPPLPKWLNRFS